MNIGAFEIGLNILAVDLSKEEIEKRLINVFGKEFILHKRIVNYSPSYKKSKGRKTLRKLLLQRDGNLCCWCKGQMILDFNSTDPMSCTIEHVKRKSDGGSNSLDNLALAHRVCNNERHK